MVSVVRILSIIMVLNVLIFQMFSKHVCSILMELVQSVMVITSMYQIIKLVVKRINMLQQVGLVLLLHYNNVLKQLIIKLV